MIIIFRCASDLWTCIGTSLAEAPPSAYADCPAEVVAIPKSVRPEGRAATPDVIAFQLTDDEGARITGLGTARSHIFDHHDPEKVTWLGEVLLWW
ncbi:hypothetical protein [Streptomyces sp. rh34]|uniref:hypothetical protein n=1 Tax=Streptomyces sp. rh34 TaxID=2034272 RepID=UPI0015CF7D79|nr:hypothetical protein [Streptomyces sp. rh34]